MVWFRKTKYPTLRPPTQKHRIPEGMWVKCPECQEILIRKEWAAHLKVCPRCGYHERLSARERLAQLLDAGSFEETDATLISADPLGFTDLKPYPQRLQESIDKTGERDAVVSGLGRIEGQALSVAVMDFEFGGGSMGAVVGEKIARSLERALAQRIPALTVCASGGARMQEGIFSLMQMAKTAALVGRLGQARLPYLVLLTHPVTGGVTASFAMLGDVILAEPGALVGFAGPRVIEATIKQTLPAGFQTAEFVRDHGFIDMVVPRGEVKAALARVIRLLNAECGKRNAE